MKFLVPFLTICSLVLCQDPSTVNWCQVKATYCNTLPHIACAPNGLPSSPSSNSNPRPVELTQTQKDSLLAAHNNDRNRLASGEFVTSYGFPKAAKLSVMKWDNTLEYLAKTHASLGYFEHDKCRATPTYPYSGQNIFQMFTTGTVNVASAIVQGVDSWFNEYKVANKSLVGKFEMNHLAAAGHFSVIVNDKNNRLGCGAVLVDSKIGNKTYNSLMLTCNYQYTNMLNTPTYVAGTPCSSCSCSTTYTSLCADS